MTSEIVFDASALLAMIREEPGGEAVATAIGRARMSTVNFAEVVSYLAYAGVPADQVNTMLIKLPMRVIDADAGLRLGRWPSARDHSRSRPVARRPILHCARRQGPPSGLDRQSAMANHWGETRRGGRPYTLGGPPRSSMPSRHPVIWKILFGRRESRAMVRAI